MKELCEEGTLGVLMHGLSRGTYCPEGDWEEFRALSMKAGSQAYKLPLPTCYREGNRGLMAI